MGQPFIESLDDPLIPDGTVNFSGGMDGQTDPSEIEPTAFASLINCVAKKVSDIQTRNGSTKIGTALAAAKIQGIGELDTASTELILAACNGSMFKWNGSAWSAAGGYSPTSASVAVDIVQGNDILYVADGTKNLFSWDGTTFTDLGTGGSKPPIGSMLEWFKSRMFISGNSVNNDTVWVCNPLDVAAGWDYSAQSFRIGGGEGDAVTAIFGWKGNTMLAFKYNSFYAIDADPSNTDVANWGIEILSDNVGCFARRSVAMVGNDVYFLSRDGVRSVLRTQQGNSNEISLPLSWPIQPLIDRINWTYASKSCAISFDNKYMISVPLDTATEPNVWLIYDTRIQRWLGHWTGMAATAFLLSKLGNSKKLYFGATDGRVVKWNNDSDDTLAATFLDDGVDIATTMTTRAMRFGDNINRKQGFNAMMEFCQSLAIANCYAILDQGEDQNVAIGFDTQQTQNQLPVDLPFDLAVIGNTPKAFDLMSLPDFMELQLKLTSTSSKLSLKSIGAEAFLNTSNFEQ